MQQKTILNIVLRSRQSADRKLYDCTTLIAFLKLIQMPLRKTITMLCFFLSEEDEGNPAALSKGSSTDTDEGTIMNSQQSVFAFLGLIMKKKWLSFFFC